MVYLDIINNMGYKVDREDIVSVIENVLMQKGVGVDVELALLLVDELRMRELHKKYLVTDEVTDVLSFPLDMAVFPDGIKRLGDIVVCLPEADRKAQANSWSLDNEINFLVEHGLRHLLGEHHE